MKQLQGRVAVVTGASTGIGRAVARSFANEGMRLVLASQNAERLADAVDELRADGFPVIGVPTDVGDESQVQALADATLNEYGVVHVLFTGKNLAVSVCVDTSRYLVDAVLIESFEQKGVLA